MVQSQFGRGRIRKSAILAVSCGSLTGGVWRDPGPLPSIVSQPSCSADLREQDDEVMLFRNGAVWRKFGTARENTQIFPDGHRKKEAHGGKRGEDSRKKVVTLGSDWARLSYSTPTEQAGKPNTAENLDKTRGASTSVEGVEMESGESRVPAS